MSQFDKAAVSRKVQALLAKAGDCAATEAEALAAADKAQQLLAKYQMSLSETELIKDGFDERKVSRHTMQSSYIQRQLGDALGRYTSTQAFWNKLHTTRIFAVYYVGLKGDVDFVQYLAQMLERFILREMKKQPRPKRLDFRQGLIDGICRHLLARSDSLASAQGQLVNINKEVIVTDEFCRRYPGCKEESLQRRNPVDRAAYVEGTSKAESVNLNRPINKHTDKMAAIASS